MEINVSVIFQIIDRFKKRPLLASEATIFVNNRLLRPIYKPGGYFVFTNLEPGMTSFEIVSPFFQKEKVEMEIPQPGKGYLLRHMLLNPGKLYSFESSATLVSGRIITKNTPFAEKLFYMYPCKGGEILKIAEDNAVAGNSNIKLFAIVPDRYLSIPGMYIIMDKDKAKKEVCLITRGKDKDGIFSLESGLKFSHSRGTPLVGAIECKTSSEGEFFTVVPVWGKENEKVNIDIFTNSEDDKSIKKTIEIEIGKKNNLGDIEV